MASLYNYLIASGVITVDAADVLAEVQTEYQLAFGADLILTANTPQGVLMTAETLARIAVADNNAAIANQINPNFAGGIFLDAIMQLTGIQRQPGQPTVCVGVALTGIPGTFIPTGSQARESVTQVLFQSITDVTLAIDGTGTATFETLTDEPVTVGVGALSIIVSNILGWETVSNPTAAEPGKPEMSDTGARLYRTQTLFAQGSSLAGAIIAGVRQVEGVTSMSFLENIASTIEVIEGVTMSPHSIYMCIAGDYSTLDVAEAITSKKSGGCDYNNGASGDPISQPVTSPYSGQIIDVLFDKPDAVPIYVIVTASLGLATLSDPATAVKDAIVAYANGEIEGQPGLVVGASVSGFELAAAVNSQVTGLYVTNIQIGVAPAPTLSTTIDIEIWEQAEIDSDNIVVNIS